MTSETSVSVEVRGKVTENPFQANGELSRKADYIISHSRISRTEVQIVDPDSPQPRAPSADDGDDSHAPLPALHANDTIAEEPIEPVKSVQVQGVNDGGSPVANNNSSSSNAKQETVVVEAEVKKSENANDANPQKAEQVKLKTKKSCCSVQ